MPLGRLNIFYWCFSNRCSPCALIGYPNTGDHLQTQDITTEKKNLKNNEIVSWFLVYHRIILLDGILS